MKNPEASQSSAAVLPATPSPLCFKVCRNTLHYDGETVHCITVFVIRQEHAPGSE